MPDEALLQALRDRSYFFDAGLRFQCRQCGACCNGAPGVIYVMPREVEEIAEFVDIEREVFIARCLYPFQGSHSIREDDTGRCIFYEGGCAIYPVRPLQCRTFPFWFQNLRSREAWRRVAEKCPGIGHGHCYTKEEIFTVMESSYELYEAVKDLLP